MPPKMPMRARGKANMQKAKKGTLKRLLSMLFKNNKMLLFVILACIIISAVTGVTSSIFLNQVLTQLTKAWGLIHPNTGVGLSPIQAWNTVYPELLKIFI